MPKKGEKMSQEQKDKISASMKALGKAHTKPAQEALKAYRELAHQTYVLQLQMQKAGVDVGEIGDGKFYHHSEETKAKISRKLKAIGHKPNAEARKKLAAYRLQKSRDARIKKRLRELGFTED